MLPETHSGSTPNDLLEYFLYVLCVVFQLDQPTLGMMSREYFLDDSESKYKEAYLKYMISIAQLLGANETHAVKEMNDVLDFEVQLANVSF